MSPKEVISFLSEFTVGPYGFIGDPMVWVAQVKLPPEAAALLLSETNNINRPIRPGPLADRILDMQQGRFQRTHQGVALSNETPVNLLDGQHTLKSNADSGASPSFMISVGWPRSVMQVLDSSPARSIANRLMLGFGFEADNMEISTARNLKVCGQVHAVRLATHVIAETMTRHADAIDFACKHLPARRLVSVNGGVRGCVARAYYTVDHARLARFCEVVMGGAFDEHEAAAAMLPKYLAGTSRDVAYAFQITQRALDAFVNGRAIKALRPMSETIYPLPEETEPQAN